MRDTRISARYAKALYLLTERRAAREGVPLVSLLERSLEDLAGFALLARGNRLSVLPVTKPQWNFILGLE
jgi:predicted RNA-binding protein with PUA-like domain